MKSTPDDRPISPSPSSPPPPPLLLYSYSSPMSSLSKKQSSEPDKDSKDFNDNVRLDTSDVHPESTRYHGATVSLERNVNAVVENPLAGIPKDQLMADVADFCTMAGLTQHLDVFQKAALVAQEPANFASVPSLSSEEKDSLTREVTHRWSLPSQLWLLIFVISLGSVSLRFVIEDQDGE